MRLSSNDVFIFCTAIGAVCFFIVALINKYLGISFYEPLQTALLIAIVQGIAIKR